MASCYIFTSEGEGQSHLHKTLIGRQRRDVQREILSILGLNHRPRLHGPRSIESSSAPLYMLGLYSSASHSLDQDVTMDTVQIAKSNENDRKNVRGEDRNQRRSSRQFRFNQRGRYPPFQTNANLRQYIEDSGILTNEIGVAEPEERGSPEIENRLNGGLGDLTTERILAERSDLIISFINTKQQQVLEEQSLSSLRFHPLLRRHRSFFFDISQISPDDRLAAAKFRLYKERSDSVFGNISLRVNVYQAVVGYDGRFSSKHHQTKLRKVRRVGDDVDYVDHINGTGENPSKKEYSAPSFTFTPSVETESRSSDRLATISITKKASLSLVRTFRNCSTSKRLNMSDVARYDNYHVIDAPYYSGDFRSAILRLGGRLVGSHQEGWLVFDVTSAFSDWIARPRGNQGLKVTVETLQGRFLKPTKTGLVGRRGSSTKQAFVVAFFNQGKPDLLRPNIRRRFRRSVDFGLDVSNNLTGSDTTDQQGTIEDYDDDDDDEDDDNENNGNEEEEEEEEDDDSPTTTVTTTASNDELYSRTITKRKIKSRKKGRRRKKPSKNSSKRNKALEPCQRKQFYVDFKDLGWHTWIIAPKAYKAYQCYGKCSFPLNAGLNVTNHAIVQSLVHVRLKPLNIPEPCCAPSKLEPLEILFFNDQTKVIYKKYSDMVVSACGCH